MGHIIKVSHFIISRSFDDMPHDNELRLLHADSKHRRKCVSDGKTETQFAHAKTIYALFVFAWRLCHLASIMQAASFMRWILLHSRRARDWTTFCPLAVWYDMICQRHLLSHVTHFKTFCCCYIISCVSLWAISHWIIVHFVVGLLTIPVHVARKRIYRRVSVYPVSGLNEVSQYNCCACRVFCRRRLALSAAVQFNL